MSRTIRKFEKNFISVVPKNIKYLKVNLIKAIQDCYTKNYFAERNQRQSK